MARRIYRYFTAVDCNYHLGLPIRVSCFILTFIATAFNVYTLYFLPDVWRYIIMVYAAATGSIGVIATLTGIQFLTIIYLLAESLVLLPTGVVISYVFYTILNGHKCTNGWWYNNWHHFCPDAYTDYETWLFTQEIGILWSALTVGVVSFPVTFTTLAGFRKLRLYQKSLRSECHEEATRVETHHHHHHTPTAVVTVPQPTVVSTFPPQQTTVITAHPSNIVMQAYPQIQPEVAQVYPTYQNPPVQPITYLPYDKN